VFGDWIVELRRKGRSPNTIHCYEKVYEHNIRPTLGTTAVTKVTTKKLTDLYGAHQARGLAPRSVYQIHAVVSSMFTQACRWGWRDSNPAQWAEPPARPNTAPIVASPAEVRALIEAAEQSRRPEYARALLVAATTGLRRAELCGLRRARDLDLEAGAMTVSSSVAAVPGESVQEIPTKNRRSRSIALDDLTVSMLRTQLAMVDRRARRVGAVVVRDAFVFSDAVDGSVPWKPSSVTQYFNRLRERAELSHLNLHSLRKFMETYGQEMGYSLTQVAMRAGHNPSVAAKHYSGRVSETDRALASAVASLLAVDRNEAPTSSSD
jgi:integrase